MRPNMNSILLLFTLCMTALQSISRADDETTNDEISATTIDILRMRGYSAIDHYFTTPDGYIINLIQAINPLISSPQKDPLLCLHGIMVSSKYLVVNSVDARPRNYSSLNAATMKPKKLNSLLLEDPAAKNLIFLALNFGHSLWIINQRGTTPSQGHVDKQKQAYISPARGSSAHHDYLGASAKLATKFLALKATLNEIPNPVYWNFSSDEQIRYDIPLAIDYILEQTKRDKLSVMSHSQGGNLILGALSENPSLARKISRNLLWAPALQPTGWDEKLVAPFLSPILSRNLGPVPGALLGGLLKGAWINGCKSELAQTTICRNLLHVWFGYSADQLIVKPGFLSALFNTASAYGMAQMAQAVTKGGFHYFDYRDAQKNMAAYGQSTAPAYNLSNINEGCMSFWAGGTDVLAPLVSVKNTIEQLGTRAQQNYLNQSGVYFNHIGFFFHKQVARLLVLPSLKYLHS